MRSSSTASVASSALDRRIPSFVAAASAVLFLLLAALVAHGSLTRIDQHAVAHLMPWAHPPFRGGTSIAGLFLPRTEPTAVGTVVSFATYPASVLPSALLVGWAALVLRARGLVLPALAWTGAWLAGNAVEVIGKAVLERPALTSHGVHVASFDHSYPSGHALRAAIVAAAVTWTWRRAWPALVWALGVPFALVAIGAHTPSDVVGGLLAAFALIAAHALLFAPARPRGGGGAA